jgi:hypothetical protein
MTPRPHRRRSSKESPARHYNAFEVAVFLYSGALEFGFALLITAASFPTSDSSLAYGYQSRYSGGAAISR